MIATRLRSLVPPTPLSACLERCGSGAEVHVSLLSPGPFDEEPWQKDAVKDILRRCASICCYPSRNFRRAGSVLC